MYTQINRLITTKQKKKVSETKQFINNSCFFLEIKLYLTVLTKICGNILF